MNPERVTSDVLSSISGVLIFLSLAYWIDLNGYTSFAPAIILAGLLIVFFPRPFLKALSPLGFITKPFLFTLSHILIFIGGKVYFDQYIDNYWIIYLILGIVLLNNHRTISKRLWGTD